MESETNFSGFWQPFVKALKINEVPKEAFLDRQKRFSCLLFVFKEVKYDRTIYFWMTFQILMGIWIFISPFVFHFRESMGASTNNMILGEVVVLPGFGVALYEFYHKEEVARVSGMEHARERVS